jgi:putative hydroxymethylpyrimidine transporter CytX
MASETHTSSYENADNSALYPVPESARAFGWGMQASLWFSLGVGLLVIQMGSYLSPALGSQEALSAIVAGSLLGSGLLAWTASIGARTGLSSAGIMHMSFGSGFARLPVVLNIVQLLGWTTFELVIMRDGSQAIVKEALGFDASGTLGTVICTLVWSGVLTLLLAGSMVTLVRKTLSRYALPLVIASMLWLSYQFGLRAQALGWDSFWSRAGDGSMGWAGAFDLVVAMPVSWLPLVADYARHSRTERGALGGTWLGYGLANIWCYALGLLVVSVAAPGADLVSVLLLAQGGLMALSLILVDEIDNAYGDVHSAAVSTHSLQSRWSVRAAGLGIATLCTVLALVLPMRDLEPFLLLLSSVFVPLFGVILGRMGTSNASPLTQAKVVDWSAAFLWLAGIALYQGISRWAPQWGATLPTLGATLLAAWLTRHKQV